LRYPVSTAIAEEKGGLSALSWECDFPANRVEKDISKLNEKNPGALSITGRRSSLLAWITSQRSSYMEHV